jgi:hypothetical protein
VLLCPQRTIEDQLDPAKEAAPREKLKKEEAADKVAAKP